MCACVPIQMISVDRYLLTAEYKATFSGRAQSLQFHLPDFSSSQSSISHHGINDFEGSAVGIEQYTSCDNGSSCKV